MRDFLKFLFRSLVICKNYKDLASTNLFFYIFVNNSRSKQNKKNPQHPFVDIIKKKTCFFTFLLITQDLNKIKKNPQHPFVDIIKKKTCFFTFLLITQDLNKIKKNPQHPFVDIIKKKTCAKLQQKMLNSMVVGARKNFQFFR